MQQQVQGSRSGTGVLLLIFFAATLSLTGCGANKKDLSDKWESQKQRAFQEFRDRRYDNAIETYGKALELAKQIDPDGIQVASTLNEMAVVYTTRNSSKNAAGLYLEASAIEQNWLNKDPFDPNIQRTYLDTMAGLGKIRKTEGDLKAAEEYFSRGVDIGRRANVPSKLRELLYEYKSVLQQEGKTKESMALNDEFTRLAGNERLPNDEDSLREQTNKLLADAESAFKAHDLNRADEQYRQAYLYVKRSTDAKFRAEGEARVASYLCTVGNLPAAEAALMATMRDCKKSGSKESGLLPFLISYADVEHQLGKNSKSKDAADLALKLAKEDYPPTSPQVNSALLAVANAMIGMNQYEQAIPVFEKSYILTKKNSAFDSPSVIMNTCWLSNLYWMADQQEKAEALMGSYTNSVRRYPKSLTLVGRLLNDYAVALQRGGNAREAALFANSAIKVLKQARDGSSEMNRATHLVKALQTPKSS